MFKLSVEDFSLNHAWFFYDHICMKATQLEYPLSIITYTMTRAKTCYQQQEIYNDIIDYSKNWTTRLHESHEKTSNHPTTYRIHLTMNRYWCHQWTHFDLDWAWWKWIPVVCFQATNKIKVNTRYHLIKSVEYCYKMVFFK